MEQTKYRKLSKIISERGSRIKFGSLLLNILLNAGRSCHFRVAIGNHQVEGGGRAKGGGRRSRETGREGVVGVGEKGGRGGGVSRTCPSK